MGIVTSGMIILLALSGGLPEIMWQGDEGTCGSIASSGMGNTVYADVSPEAALTNPAIASELPEGFTFGVTGMLTLDVEKRTRRVYDSFGGVVGESEYSFNQNFQPLPGGVAVSWKSGEIAASVGWRASSTFGYNYTRVMNDDNYVKIGQEILEVSGILNDIGASFAWAQSEMFSFGAGGSYVMGTRSLSSKINWVDPTVTDVDEEVDTDISGLITRASVGAALDRVSLYGGIEYYAGWKTEVATVSNDVTLPLIARVGLRYQPGNRLLSLFAADFWWSGTSSVEIEDVDAGLRNSWGFGAGVENTLPGNTIARVGFEYDSSPIVAALNRMKFTTGLGWAVNELLSVDAAISFSPVRWDQYQNDGLPSFIPGDSLVVESSRTAFSAGITQVF